MQHQNLSIALILGFIGITGVAVAASPDTDRISATLQTLQTSVNAHDFGLLEPQLAEDFTYQGREAGLSRAIIRQVVEGFPHNIETISILSITADDAGWSIGVRIDGPGGAEERKVRLDRDYLILQADIADIQLSNHAAQPTQQASATSLPDVASIPFRTQEGLIVVQAKLNGVYGNFLVDTGAQATVVNSIHFDSDQLPTLALDHDAPSGVGGAMTGVRGARDLDLEWGELHFDVPRALAVDLSHLEASLGIKVVGLIGFDILERFEIRFDYAAGILNLYRLGIDGRPVLPLDDEQPTAVVSLDMTGHIPVLSAEIGGQSVRLGLDSGASDAMLAQKWEDQLADKYAFVRTAELRGADKNVRMGSEVRFDLLRVENVNYENQHFRFNEIVVAGGAELAMDGLLGYQFLSARPTSINFRTRQLKIW